MGLATEQSTKFELVVSLKTAKALKIMIPEPFLPRADEIVRRILLLAVSAHPLSRQFNVR